MTSIRATSEFGLVIRRAALAAKNVTYEALLRAAEMDAPLDENADLIALGPTFGEEAMAEFTRRFEALGLAYWDDFFEITEPVPDWCGLRVDIRGD